MIFNKKNLIKNNKKIKQIFKSNQNKIKKKRIKIKKKVPIFRKLDFLSWHIFFLKDFLIMEILKTSQKK